jgi:hypothetical protein
VVGGCYRAETNQSPLLKYRCIMRITFSLMKKLVQTFETGFYAACFVAFLCPGTNSLAQSERHAAEAKHFLLRLASEREKLVQYEVHCFIRNLDSKANLQEIPDYLRDADVRIEYSRVDSHHIHMRSEDSPRVGTQNASWQWKGHSANYYISGQSGAKYSHQGAAVRPLGDEIQRLLLFDIRGLGLGFCGDFARGTPFERIISNRLKSKDDYVKHGSDGIVEFKCPDLQCANWEIDTRRGYWPKKTSSPYADWEIALGEAHGYSVPISAKLTCKSGDAKSSIEIKLKWLSINEPFSVGIEAAERLALDFGLRVPRLPPTQSR